MGKGSRKIGDNGRVIRQVIREEIMGWLKKMQDSKAGRWDLFEKWRI